MTHPSPTALEEKNAIAATDRNAADVKTDGAVPSVVLAAVKACAASWVPDARLLGNVRAGDIIRAIAALEADYQRMYLKASENLEAMLDERKRAEKAEAQLATRLPTEAQISYLLEVLAREGVANAGGDFMRRKISKAILALLSGAATPAPTAALTEEELLTPELIKKAADAGERVGWDDVLTPNAQIYHRAIDLKKYETALRAVLPIIIDRLAKSPPQGAATPAPTAALTEEEREQRIAIVLTAFEEMHDAAAEASAAYNVEKFAETVVSRLTGEPSA